MQKSVDDLIELLKIIFDALLILVLIGALALLLAPQLMGARLLVVLSQSMEPTVPMGSIVVSLPVSASEIAVGDLITFHSTGPDGSPALVTHRVVEVVDDGIAVRFRTKGDAVEEPDLNLVEPHNLVGRVLFNVPMVGYLVGFVHTPLGLFALVGLPAALLVIGEIAEIIWNLGAGKRRRAAKMRPNPGGKKN
jgi:signal peptidase